MKINERLIWGISLVLMLIGILMIAMSRSPVIYSFAENDRAKAACEGMEDRGRAYALCYDNALKQWRKEHPDEPRGSASAWPWDR
ncbi:hypothetical protein ABIB99_002032 [Bradyrhizobium sp. LA6.1]